MQLLQHRGSCPANVVYFVVRSCPPILFLCHHPSSRYEKASVPTLFGREEGLKVGRSTVSFVRRKSRELTCSQTEMFDVDELFYKQVLELGEFFFFSNVCKSVGNAESLNINKSCGELGECFGEGGNFGITCLDASRFLGVFFIMFCSHSVKA